MKALSLWQPWASAIAVKAKRIETRGWSTDYRGPLAIHAARTTTGLLNLAFAPTLSQTRAQRIDLWASVFGMPPHKSMIDVLQDLPRGVIVATCSLVDVVPTAALVAGIDLTRYTPFGAIRERELGDFAPGRYAWLLENIVALAEPVPCRGRQGLFDVELEAV